MQAFKSAMQNKPKCSLKVNKQALSLSHFNLYVPVRLLEVNYSQNTSRLSSKQVANQVSNVSPSGFNFLTKKAYIPDINASDPWYFLSQDPRCLGV